MRKAMAMTSFTNPLFLLLSFEKGPEKRKWAQVSPRRGVMPTTATPSSVGGGSEYVRIKSRPRSAVLFQQQQQYLAADGYSPSERSSSSANLDCCYSASSDDEVQALVGGNTPQVSLLTCCHCPQREIVSKRLIFRILRFRWSSARPRRREPIGAIRPAPSHLRQSSSSPRRRTIAFPLPRPRPQ